MYADDTKIWRQMHCINDHMKLQNDINYLFDRAVKNKMKFHASKCKVLVASKYLYSPPHINLLPCASNVSTGWALKF